MNELLEYMLAQAGYTGQLTRSGERSWATGGYDDPHSLTANSLD